MSSTNLSVLVIPPRVDGSRETPWAWVERRRVLLDGRCKANWRDRARRQTQSREANEARVAAEAHGTAIFPLQFLRVPSGVNLRLSLLVASKINYKVASCFSVRQDYRTGIYRQGVNTSSCLQGCPLFCSVFLFLYQVCIFFIANANPVVFVVILAAAVTAAQIGNDLIVHPTSGRPPPCPVCRSKGEEVCTRCKGAGRIAAWLLRSERSGDLWGDRG